MVIEPRSESGTAPPGFMLRRWTHSMPLADVALAGRPKLNRTRTGSCGWRTGSSRFRLRLGPARDAKEKANRARP